MPRPDFRATAARRLSEERDLSPAIVSLLAAERTGRSSGVRLLPVTAIEPNPQQPRLGADPGALEELTASVKEHGVLQPILVRPLAPQRYQVVAGERRWRAAQAAGLETIPALVQELDDETALEIALIENLQREDLSPLDEALIYQRMIREHGYSVRRLAQRLGKDKGYVENRLRLADAPEEIRALVSVRKDTLSHAYELLKVADPRLRQRLAAEVARGALSLTKLRERIEEATGGPRPPRGRSRRPHGESVPEVAASGAAASPPAPQTASLADDALIAAKDLFASALDQLVTVLRQLDPVTMSEVDRANLAKYLTIAKLRLENAIAALRSLENREGD